MMTFVAAPMALFRKSSRGFALFFAFWAATAFSAAYAIGPAHWVIQRISALSVMKNSRLVLVAGFSLAVLAGLGISALQEWQADKSRRRGWFAMLAVAAGSAPAIVLIYLVHQVSAHESIAFVRSPRFGMFLLAAGLALVWFRLAGRISSTLFASFTLILITVDLTTVSYGAIPFTKPRDVFPSVELFHRLPPPSVEPFRIAQAGAPYGANFEVMYGHAALGGYELPLERIKTFLSDISRDEMDSVMLTTTGILGIKDRRLDMLCAKYYVVSEWDPHYMEFRTNPERFRFMYSSGDTDVYENLTALPPAYIVPAGGIEVIRDETEQLRRVKDPNFDAEHHVILPEPSPVPAPPPSQTVAITTPKVEWTSRTPNSFELDVNTYQPSVLVVSQVDYPGWKAYVDGNPVRMTRANYAFPAIFISSGPHHVRFSFDPWTFKVGLALTALAAVILGIMVMPRLRHEE
jgi:hypothetical protein